MAREDQGPAEGNGPGGLRPWEYDKLVTTWTQKQVQDKADADWRRGYKTGFDRGWNSGLLTASLVTSVLWAIITALMKR